MKTTLFAVASLALSVTARDIPVGVPDYVIRYAPIVYLSSEDVYLPSDIATQLQHTQPQVNFQAVSNAPSELTLDNLSSLNNAGGRSVYLTSRDNIETSPAWLYGVAPDSNGKTNDAITSTVIVNDHGNGIVDAFYMYFYAFNYGGKYFDFAIIGDHVGDWEHNMVRFNNGVPQAVWYSQHANGQAFTYDALDKYNGGVRPIAFSANGSHATYAIDGTHDHSIPNFNLPFGPVEDHTDHGPIWDPTLSAYYVKYDAGSQSFSAYDDATPLDWLNFAGAWGDKQYPESDPRQRSIFKIKGTYKYGDGPTGPKDKQLDRKDICPDNGNKCLLRPFLTP